MGLGAKFLNASELILKEKCASRPVEALTVVNKTDEQNFTKYVSNNTI